MSREDFAEAARLFKAAADRSGDQATKDIAAGLLELNAALSADSANMQTRITLLADKLNSIETRLNVLVGQQRPS